MSETWHSAVDKVTGRTFYYNDKGKSVWDNPALTKAVPVSKTDSKPVDTDLLAEFVELHLKYPPDEFAKIVAEANGLIQLCSFCISSQSEIIRQRSFSLIQTCFPFFDSETWAQNHAVQALLECLTLSSTLNDNRVSILQMLCFLAAGPRAFRHFADPAIVTILTSIWRELPTWEDLESRVLCCTLAGCLCDDPSLMSADTCRSIRITVADFSSDSVNSRDISVICGWDPTRQLFNTGLIQSLCVSHRELPLLLAITLITKITADDDTCLSFLKSGGVGVIQYLCLKTAFPTISPSAKSLLLSLSSRCPTIVEMILDSWIGLASDLTMSMESVPGGMAWECSGGSLSIHDYILSTRCSQSEEFIQERSGSDVLVTNDLTKSVVERLLMFIYCGTCIMPCDAVEICDLYLASRKMGMPSLMCLCLDEIENALQPDSVEKVESVARTYKIPELFSVCNNYREPTPRRKNKRKKSIRLVSASTLSLQSSWSESRESDGSDMNISFADLSSPPHSAKSVNQYKPASKPSARPHSDEKKATPVSSAIHESSRSVLDERSNESHGNRKIASAMSSISGSAAAPSSLHKPKKTSESESTMANTDHPSSIITNVLESLSADGPEEYNPSKHSIARSEVVDPAERNLSNLAKPKHRREKASQKPSKASGTTHDDHEAEPSGKSSASEPLDKPAPAKLVKKKDVDVPKQRPHPPVEVASNDEDDDASHSSSSIKATTEPKRRPEPAKKEDEAAPRRKPPQTPPTKAPSAEVVDTDRVPPAADSMKSGLSLLKVKRDKKRYSVGVDADRSAEEDVRQAPSQLSEIYDDSDQQPPSSIKPVMKTDHPKPQAKNNQSIPTSSRAPKQQAKPPVVLEITSPPVEAPSECLRSSSCRCRMCSGGGLTEEYKELDESEVDRLEEERMELEARLREGKNSLETERLKSRIASSSEKIGDMKSKPKKPSKWKSQSESFRDAIVQAREMKQCELEGRPPPKALPSTPDPSLIECPHCSRRFNEDAASRHIPICKDKNQKPNLLKRGSGINASNGAKRK